MVALGMRLDRFAHKPGAMTNIMQGCFGDVPVEVKVYGRDVSYGYYVGIFADGRAMGNINLERHSRGWRMFVKIDWAGWALKHTVDYDKVKVFVVQWGLS